MSPDQDRGDGYPAKSSLKGMAERPGSRHNGRRDMDPRAPMNQVNVENNSLRTSGGDPLTSAPSRLKIYR
jgi:hypothetical protein